MTQIKTRAETAAALKKVLATMYPGTKFSVRSKDGVSVMWTDGPTEDHVRFLAEPFEWATFESMDDSTRSKGTMYGRTPWAGYCIMTHRRISPEAIAKARQHVEQMPDGEWIGHRRSSNPWEAGGTVRAPWPQATGDEVAELLARTYTIWE